MITDLLFGLKLTDIESAKNLVEKVLDLKLNAHESSYVGDYYRADGPGDEEIVLQENYDRDDEEWTEPDHQDMALLLYINESTRADMIESKLKPETGFKLLERENAE
jgi:hypothetical protein